MMDWAINIGAGLLIVVLLAWPQLKGLFEKVRGSAFEPSDVDEKVLAISDCESFRTWAEKNGHTKSHDLAGQAIAALYEVKA